METTLDNIKIGESFDIAGNGRCRHGFERTLTDEQKQLIRRQSPERVRLVHCKIRDPYMREVYAAVEEALGYDPGSLTYPWLQVDVRVPDLHRNVITLVFMGKSNHEIQEALHISEDALCRILSHAPYLAHIHGRRASVAESLIEADFGFKELLSQSVQALKDLLVTGNERTRSQIALSVVKSLGDKVGAADIQTGVSGESVSALKLAASDAVNSVSVSEPVVSSAFVAGDVEFEL